MNSQFFSIDSIIGAKSKTDEERNDEAKSDGSETSEPKERKRTEHSPNNNSGDENHRRLKIPSYHTSTRDPERADRTTHESTSSGGCHSSTCGTSQKSENNSRCEDHRGSSESCPNSCKAIPKQKRLSLTKHQLGELEKCFLKNYYPTEATREELAIKLGLSHARVKVWFQNRRAKWQRNQKMKSEWQSFLHNPFATALGLSHQRLMFQQHQQLLGDPQSKEFDPQCLQAPATPFYSPFAHSNMAFMLPRQDLMSYTMAKPSLQAIDAYMLAKQAAEHENNVKNCISDDSDSEETSKTTKGSHSPNTNAASSTASPRSLPEKNIVLPPGQFWW